MVILWTSTLLMSEAAPGLETEGLFLYAPVAYRTVRQIPFVRVPNPGSILGVRGRVTGLGLQGRHLHMGCDFVAPVCFI